MLHKNFSYQSANIFYRTTGKGKPVALLHGFGEDDEVWDKQINFLKDHFTLIIPDLPGSGQSEMIADMSMEGMAEVIKAIVEEEKIDSCAIIGHSMGGYISLAFAEKYPELLTAFGLFHSSAFADSEEKKATRLKAIEFIKNNGSYSFFKASTPGLFTAAWSNEHQDEIEALIDKIKDISPEALIQYYQAMIARPGRTTVLKTFHGSILFIIGANDKAVPFEQSIQQCYLPAQSHIHILRNSAHMGMWEEADKANAALLEFLSNQ
ncbi:MAG: alpha/beta hydrolase [Ferruginibacter sp.]